VDVASWLGEADMQLDDLTYLDVPPADVVTAFAQGSAQSGFLTSPYFQQLEEQRLGQLVFPDANGSYGAGMLVGGLADRPDELQAFLRVIARTIDTYLQPGYKQNADTVNALATAIGVDAAVVAAGTETPFDSSFPMEWEKQMALAQDVWIQLGVVEYDTPLTIDQVVDASFAEAIQP
jgi:NitT/TauT family transport system substrate-binding protein